jgi:PAS domain S-box-containing protein
MPLDHQLDYIFFVYGLSFLLLAAVSCPMRRDRRAGLPWGWLFLFGLTHGINEWADMLALSFGGPSACAVARLGLLIGSFVCLLEFGRAGLAGLGRRVPRWWIHVPLLCVVGLGALAGLPVANALARYVLGLPGGLLAAWAFWRASQTPSQGTCRRALRLAAVAMGLYALAAGVVVAPAGFIPASVLNSATFAASLGFPIQLLRGLLACAVTWAVWRQFSVSTRAAVLDADHTADFRRECSTAAALVLLLSVGWAVADAVGRLGENSMRLDMLNETQLGAATIDVGSVGRLRWNQDDLQSADYQSLKAWMKVLQKAAIDCRFASLVGVQGDRVFILVDSEPPTSADYSPPGERYREAAQDYVRQLQAGEPFVIGPLHDRWGTWMTGAVPLEVPTRGKVFLAFDLNADRWDATVALYRLPAIIITALFVGLLLVASVVSQKTRDREREQAAELARVRRQQSAMVRLATSATVAAGDFHNAAAEIAETAAQALQVDRVSIWLRSQDEGPIRCVNVYERAIGCQVEGGVIWVEKIPRHFAALSSDRAVAIHDVFADPRADEIRDEYLAPKKIDALISATLRVSGRLTGLVCFSHRGGRRTWRADEVRFAAEIADQVAQALVNVERKDAERALRLAHFSIDRASDAVFWVTCDARIVYVNNAACHSLGYSPVELLEMTLHDVDPDFPSAAWAPLWQELFQKRWLRFEARHQAKDGRRIPVEVTLNYVEFEGQQCASVLARDITERMRATEDVRRYTDALATANQALEESAQAAEAANRAKSEFLANMSHEIRTPITAILGYADLLMEERLPPQTLEQLAAVKRNSEHLLSVINGVLDISKIEAGKLVVECLPCSLGELLQEIKTVMQARADAKGLRLKVTLEGLIPESLRTDPTRLRQILLNLVGNAVKFTEHGSVQIIARLVREGSPRVEIDIVDTGIGMTPEQIARVFEPFTQADSSTTRKFGGTGLGLTISKRLAETLGGDVVIASSQPGVGTRFRFTLPSGPLEGVRLVNQLPSPTVGETKPPPVAGSSTRLQCRILLAEDGPDNQRLIALILKKAGAEVVVAENGQVAVELATAARDQGMPFDVILMDMQMPILDGYDATRRLRDQGYTGAILALTAHAMSDDRQRCLDTGCNDYISKPIDRAILLATIRQHLATPVA